MSTSEAAKYLGVCRTTVARYFALGLLPAVQLPGKNLFRKADLDKLVNSETGVTTLKGESLVIDTDISELTTIDSAAKYYGTSAISMLRILNDKGYYPTVFAGIRYFRKEDIRKVFGTSPLKDTVKTQQWVTYEQIEKDHNREIDLKAEAIRSRREIEIINMEYGLFDTKVLNDDFLEFFRNEAKTKHSKWHAACEHFSRYTNGKCTFGNISIELIERFREYLLNEATNYDNQAGAR